MRYKWLNFNHNDKVIVFFNGWGMDENIVSHLNFGNYDVVMFYDYNTLETDFSFKKLNGYNDRYLVAWSMGVMIATLFPDIYMQKTAINGTLKPINNEYGIPARIYNLTIKGFSPSGANKFISNMYSSDDVLPTINRDFNNQKDELTALKNYTANLDYQFTKIIISNNDKIIPTKNQCAFWNMTSNIQGGHAIFNKFKYWSELL